MRCWVEVRAGVLLFFAFGTALSGHLLTLLSCIDTAGSNHLQGAHHVNPRGGGGVLEVGHVRARAAVEAVDHLPKNCGVAQKKCRSRGVSYPTINGQPSREGFI